MSLESVHIFPLNFCVILGESHEISGPNVCRCVIYKQPLHQYMTEGRTLKLQVHQV